MIDKQSTSSEIEQQTKLINILANKIQLIEVAKTGKTIGLKGDISVYWYADPPKTLVNISLYFLKHEMENEILHFFENSDTHFTYQTNELLNTFFSAYQVEKYIPQKKKILIRFSNHHAKEDVEPLIEKKIFRKISELENLKPGQFYYYQVEGFACYCNDELFGYLEYMYNYGSCDVFHINSPQSKQLILIPAVEPYFLKADIANQCLFFSDIEGFF
jgi:ribosomal 30S subunit maturation factor RimM